MLSIVLVLALLSTLGAPAQESVALPGLPPGVDVHLGQSIHHVVYALGPPDHTQLAGETDGYPTPSPDDALALIWNDRDCPFGPSACFYSAGFANGSAELSIFSVYIDHESRPMVESFERSLGRESRIVRFEIIMDEDEIEGTFADCTSPNGAGVVLVVPSLGLDAHLESGQIRPGPDKVELLDYSLRRLEEGWPPECPEADPVTDEERRVGKEELLEDEP
jgi:hypothetical protein